MILSERQQRSNRGASQAPNAGRAVHNLDRSASIRGNCTEENNENEEERISLSWRLRLLVVPPSGGRIELPGFRLKAELPTMRSGEAARNWEAPNEESGTSRHFVYFIAFG